MPAEVGGASAVSIMTVLLTSLHNSTAFSVQSDGGGSPHPTHSSEKHVLIKLFEDFFDESGADYKSLSWNLDVGWTDGRICRSPFWYR